MAEGNEEAIVREVVSDVAHAVKKAAAV
jgi:hypothetical protein